MAQKGIDVSVWQGNIDFQKVKASGIDFVIIRAGYSTGSKDRWFDANYKKAKVAGLAVGAYWYSYAESAEEAKREAQFCKTVLHGKQFEYPIYFDLEENSQLRRGSAFCNGLVKAFCDEMEAGGYFAGLYTSLSVANNILSRDILARYALWIAQWNTHCSYQGTYGLWQYSSDGSVPGISGRVDMNYGYIDYPGIIKAGGYNGYAKSGSQPKSQRKTVKELAAEVWQGLWGNGDERRNRLTEAGYDYEAVQAEVNRRDTSIEDLADAVLRGEYGNGEERKRKLGDLYDKVQARVNEKLSD